MYLLLYEGVVKVRQIRTFNLSKHVVDNLNNNIRRGFRSQWVEDAISDKLNNKNNFELHDFKTSELLNHIRNTRFTKLTDLEKMLIDEMRIRLEQAGE